MANEFTGHFSATFGRGFYFAKFMVVDEDGFIVFA